uniref:group II intron maturase-specific domain-containing protein n=1 Tax=Desulfogranum japonicum TaxID=231447 RepID=UPI000684E601|nr:group II intron maturase-specific domain-containing protein [Desulfogranum japonicum]
MNPTGGAIGRRVDDKPNPEEYLLERILSRANLSETWKQVKANRGAPGVDNMPLNDFMAYAWELLVKSRWAGERVMASISRFLEKKLKLKVNQEKSKVAHTNEITFLGFSFTGAKIRWSDKAFVCFKQRIKELTGRSWGVSMEYRMFKLAEYLRGWMGYFGISELYRPIPELDHWLRHRVRMCYLKQWRYCRTKVRELTKLGTFLRTAISVGLSRKGPWRLSRTLATQSGMTNQWLKDQGLLSIKDLWVKIHYPATAR